MKLSYQELRDVSDATGFPEETLEKVIRLIGLLNEFRGDPFLRSRFVLKGGTALHLFVFDLLRLSVGIDLNYTGSADREVMLDERKQFEEQISTICGNQGFSIRRRPSAHAGGKWRLEYFNLVGQKENLEVDVVFTLRVPLWNPQALDSYPVGEFVARDIPVLDLHELAAGKLSALFSRQVSRDLFDAHALLARNDLDAEKLRLGFVVYGACSRKDLRNASADNIRCDHREFRSQLLSVLRKDTVPSQNDIAAWVEQLVSECRERAKLVLPFMDNEMEFLARVNERGEVCPELLTEDDELAERIRQFPHLQWKVQNIRKREGI